MFAALRHRNFRLYLSGQSISLIGTWMQQLATSWVVYRLTQSSLWLGVSAFATQIPMFAFGLFAGVIVDRVDRHRFLFWTQALAGVQALVLALLTYAGKLNLPALIFLNFVLGMVNAMDMPLRQSFVIEMIGDRRDLPNAIALNSSVMNGTRLIGPAIAGAAIAALGEGICFLLNALSYVAVLVALAKMRIQHREPPQAQEPMLESLKSGFVSVYHDPPIRSILLLLAFMSLLGMPYVALFPALAASVPGGGPGTLGTITAAGGLGALSAGFYLARRRGAPLLGRTIGRSGLMFATGMILLALARPFALILVCVYLSGLGMLLQLASGNTVIQTLVEDSKRGRIMSMFTFALLGVAPFGSLLMGATAERFGLHTALIVHGAICAAGSLVFMRGSGEIDRHISAKFAAPRPEPGEASSGNAAPAY